MVNSYAVGTIWFQASFRSNLMSLKYTIWLVIDAQLLKIKELHFANDQHVFNNLKLKSALAIPALNDEKWSQTIQENRIWYMTASLPPCNLCVVLNNLES